ncbi:hypothetical protein DESC_810009 [Desulfosarcina cetonica]|nr:hypothetical protein DESC_810009 [Desulfosarcina cetonica]
MAMCRFGFKMGRRITYARIGLGDIDRIIVQHVSLLSFL